MLTKEDKKQLAKLRRSISKELKRLKITEPHFSVHCDYRTKKVKLNYSIYEDKGIDANNNRIVRKKQKDFYLKNISLYDEDIMLVNLPKYVDELMSLINTTIKQIGNDKDTLSHWVKVYNGNPYRRGNIKLSDKTLRGDAYSIDTLIEYLEQHEPKMMNVWNWISDGRKCLERYMKYKQTVHKNPRTNKGWSDVSVNSSYRRIRGWFNWISENLDGFPPNLLNRMPFTPPPVKMTTFKPQEMKLIKNFIKEEKGSKTWGWFIEMFIVMLETGVRITELCNMRVNDIEPTTMTWTFKGKGRFGGKERKQRFPQYVWDMISYLIVDDEGLLRTDKEYVFHQKYWKPYDKDKFGDNKMVFLEDINRPFTADGFRNKFYKMRDHLNLSKGLSPHSCRRYYITEMLKLTNGDIPLVAELVGHSSWDMVKRYAQSVITEDTKTNIGLFG